MFGRFSMELLQLRYFYESAENENFSKTAEKYMVPPSSVSMSIKKLEKELNCELFERTSNRIRLNHQGRLLQKALRSVLPVLDDAVEQIRMQGQEVQGEVWLLVRNDRRIILDYIHQFKEKHPDVAFHISHDFNTKNTARYDIIIDELTERYGNFSRIPLIKEDILLAVCESNPLCYQKILLKDLKKEAFITMCEGSSLNRITKEVCKKAGFRPNIFIESDDPHYIRKCIEMNLGVAFVPEISWKGEWGARTKFLKIADFEYKRITCAYRNNAKVLLPAAKAFYEMLENVYLNSFQ